MKKIKNTVVRIAEDTATAFTLITDELERLRKRVWDLEQDRMARDKAREQMVMEHKERME